MLVEELPKPDVLDQTFNKLLDVKTEVFQGKELALTEGNGPQLVAVLENSEQVVVGVCLVDCQAANRMGAALTMIPVENANKSIEQQEIIDDILKNMQEVMTSIVGFLNTSNLPDVKMKEIMIATDSLPESITSVINDPAIRLDLEVNLDKYGQGYLSILLHDLNN